MDQPPTPADESRPATFTARAASVMRGITVDIGPLRASRDYRFLWFGGLISFTGHQITIVAVFFQVYQLTKSPAAVGFVGLAQLVPLTIASIAGGAIVDSMDRRKILIATQLGLVTSSTALLLGALSSRPPLALIYGSIGFAAAMSGIASPTRAAMVPSMVGASMLPAAIALNQVMWSTTMIVGPAVGGIVIGAAGVRAAYAIDILTYVAGIGAAFLIKPMPPQTGTEAPRTGWKAIVEGYAFLKGRRVLQTVFTVDLVAMIFGMPRALFPILAVEQFHGGPATLGLLFSAIAFGALGGALTGGWVGRIRRQGRAVLFAVSVWGAGIIGFGLAGDRLLPAIVCLVIAGAADVISAVFRGTILQLSVPDSLRGRLSGVNILVVTGGPRLGDLEAGLVAQALTPAFSVVSGGLACLLGVGLIWLLVPEFVRYRAAGPEP